MQVVEAKDGQAAVGEVLCCVELEAGDRSAKRRAGPKLGTDRAATAWREKAQAFGVRSEREVERGLGVGTALLSPVTRTTQPQRFSSTAVYPTTRGSDGLPGSTLTARELRDTLLLRWADRASVPAQIGA